MLAAAIVVAALAGALRGADPRVPRDHAARQPDRLGPRADDLRGRRRALVVPRERPEPRRASRRDTRSRRSARSAPGSAGRRPDGLRPAASSSTVLGSASSPLRSISRGRDRASTCVQWASRRPPRTRWASTSPRYRYAHTLVGGAFAGVGGACFSLSITPQWVDGLTGGAGWIAIALVIFAFWRPDALPGRRVLLRRVHGAAVHACRHTASRSRPSCSRRSPTCDDRRTGRSCRRARRAYASARRQRSGCPTCAKSASRLRGTRSAALRSRACAGRAP